MSFDELLRALHPNTDSGQARQSQTAHNADALPVSDYRFSHFNLGFPNVFGGQFLAQTLTAVGQHLSDRGDAVPIQSLHAQFLAPGYWQAPFEYRVETLSRTKNFSRDLVRVFQKGTLSYVAQCSSKREEPSAYVHADTMPSVPSPDLLETEVQLMASYEGELTKKPVSGPRPLEIKPVNPKDWLNPAKNTVADRAFWFRYLRHNHKGDVEKRAGISSLAKQSLLAYASDIGLIGTALLPHGETWYQGNVYILSLDHSIWFYKTFEPDDWCLYHTQSPIAADGRALIQGKIFNQQGALLAVVSQEAMIRPRKHSSKTPINGTCE